MKNSLQKDAGSLNINIPTSTVPTAPIPVHTAYAVPKGKCCVALISKNMLMNKLKANPPYHATLVTPSDSFALPKQKVKPTSNKPPIIKNNQCIFRN